MQLLKCPVLFHHKIGKRSFSYTEVLNVLTQKAFTSILDAGKYCVFKGRDCLDKIINNILKIKYGKLRYCFT